ncbi:MAG: hypothetical protein LBC33_01665 [Mycoplasmataceae bacterium]|nr:hypothetical protein [Mycoplasmataceae bacterium]
MKALAWLFSILTLVGFAIWFVYYFDDSWEPSEVMNIGCWAWIAICGSVAGVFWRKLKKEKKGI